ncbi:sialate O-acetylesterase [Chitinophaga jiangningensis]|uniref:Sialate O-acetylesterase n=1 Tax=Chitinophaga jiangningensis TaxID=1419482 RepID=A0A1M7A0G4_9BACT|nr:sialate O-acetylesterase [Chitinophaga jiangningensis]SHL36033.1 sialate O-acetylesterase [Chitinophaga jiangningensis]
MKKELLIPTLLLMSSLVSAQVKLPQLLRDSMILQRDQPVKLWGTAAANEKINIQFKGKTYRTKADANGKWQQQLPPTAAGGPYQIDITASNNIRLRDVLFGDVWFCSGQSNMVHQLNVHDVTYADEIATANNPEIRQFLVPNAANLFGPQSDLNGGSWKSATSNDIRQFSAVAYFFAKQLYAQYKIPIGIINASVGGTPVDAWTSEAGLAGFPAQVATIAGNKDTSRQVKPMPPAPPPPDAGMATPTWFSTSYQPENWRTINIPGYWEDQGLRNLDGVVWYSREIAIPQSMAGKSAKVFLGRITDADELYINGVKIGNTTYQYPQRRYTVPANVLKPGLNRFVVRVTNYSGKGGFVPDKPYCIFSGTDTVDLKGYWQYKVGAVFPPPAPDAPKPPMQAIMQPTALFNAMVAPEINYAIKGICWYQGEADTFHPNDYTKLLSALIYDWRKQWQRPDLPFLYVQLPGFMDYNYLPSESNWAALREAQRKTLSVPNTAMAVAIDLGEWNDIHPDNKKEVGDRLALAARKLVYKENIIASGPLYLSAEAAGNKITLSFSDTGTGLATTDAGAPATFEIAGADKKFVWAEAKIEGDKVVVWSNNVASPVYVRYAWSDNPVNPNLINSAKLPASPFQAGVK